jgi:hypothetical protein
LLLFLQEEIDGFLTERAAAVAAAAAGDGDGSDEAADDEPAPGAKRKRSPAAGAAGQPAKRAAADEAGDLPGIQLCERSLAFASVDTWKGQKRVNLRLYYHVRTFTFFAGDTTMLWGGCLKILQLFRNWRWAGTCRHDDGLCWPVL